MDSIFDLNNAKQAYNGLIEKIASERENLNSIKTDLSNSANFSGIDEIVNIVGKIDNSLEKLSGVETSLKNAMTQCDSKIIELRNKKREDKGMTL